jgi:hypothetical protein
MKRIWIMLLSTVLALAGPARAGDLVMRDGDDRVFLTDKPCEYPPVVARSPPGLPASCALRAPR